MKGLLSFFRFLGNIALIYLAFYFLFWYIKMHFNKKWFWAFWLNTILSIFMYISHKDGNPNWPQHDSRTGAEVWEQNYGK